MDKLEGLLAEVRRTLGALGRGRSPFLPYAPGVGPTWRRFGLGLLAGAGVGAVAITSAANATASTTGASATASGGKNDATTAGEYYKGMAVFTIAKGGLMYEATIAGQKFDYKKIKSK